MGRTRNLLFFLLLLGSPSPVQDVMYSPQHPGSPFPDALLSSTSCTSAPLSPPLLDLGVDIQAELENDAPDLDFMLLDPQGKIDLVLLSHSHSLSLSHLLPLFIFLFFYLLPLASLCFSFLYVANYVALPLILYTRS